MLSKIKRKQFGDSKIKSVSTNAVVIIIIVNVESVSNVIILMGKKKILKTKQFAKVHPKVAISPIFLSPGQVEVCTGMKMRSNPNEPASCCQV